MFKKIQIINPSPTNTSNYGELGDLNYSKYDFDSSGTLDISTSSTNQHSSNSSFRMENSPNDSSKSKSPNNYVNNNINNNNTAVSYTLN